MRWILFFIIGGLIMVNQNSAMAADTSSPNGMIEKLTADMVNAIRSDKEIQAGNIQKLRPLAGGILLPHVDLIWFASETIGRANSKVTAEQRKKFQDAIWPAVMRFYAETLATVATDTTYSVSPVKLDPADTEVTVHSELKSKNRTVTFDYKLVKSKDAWKIININSNGIWLAGHHRKAVELSIEAYGIDGAIAKLEEKNKEPVRSYLETEKLVLIRNQLKFLSSILDPKLVKFHHVFFPNTNPPEEILFSSSDLEKYQNKMVSDLKTIAVKKITIDLDVNQGGKYRPKIDEADVKSFEIEFAKEGRPSDIVTYFKEQANLQQININGKTILKSGQLFYDEATGHLIWSAARPSWAASDWNESTITAEAKKISEYLKAPTDENLKKLGEARDGHGKSNGKKIIDNSFYSAVVSDGEFHVTFHKPVSAANFMKPFVTKKMHAKTALMHDQGFSSSVTDSSGENFQFEKWTLEPQLVLGKNPDEKINALKDEMLTKFDAIVYTRF